MADVAFINSWQMLRMLAGCNTAVVAAAAGAGHNIRMIEYRGKPGISCVAIVAVVTAGNMISWFAVGNAAVVTGAARANNLRMVDPEDWFPSRCTMTIFADVSRVDVVRPLAFGDAPVVAAETVAAKTVVVKIGGDPRCRVVAILTIIAAGDVLRRFAGCHVAVVATAATADGLKMVDAPDG